MSLTARRAFLITDELSIAERERIEAEQRAEKERRRQEELAAQRKAEEERKQQERLERYVLC